MAQATERWSGAERRSGHDRRVGVMARDEERRHEERRRGGIGTHKANPLEELLEGIPTARSSDPSAPVIARARPAEDPSAADAAPAVGGGSDGAGASDPSGGADRAGGSTRGPDSTRAADSTPAADSTRAAGSASERASGADGASAGTGSNPAAAVGAKASEAKAAATEAASRAGDQLSRAGDQLARMGRDAGASTGGLRRRLAPAHEPHDAIPSLAAIGGHPLHPMLVPLPIGAVVGALASDLALAAGGDTFFARSARLLTGAAVATGALGGALGAIDFWGRGRIRSHPAAWVHAGGNLAAVGIGALSFVRRARATGDDEARAAVLPAGLALSATAGAILLLTGWLGGELSYRHRVGVVPSGEEASA